MLQAYSLYETLLIPIISLMLIFKKVNFHHSLKLMHSFLVLLWDFIFASFEVFSSIVNKRLRRTIGINNLKSYVILYIKKTIVIWDSYALRYLRLDIIRPIKKTLTYQISILFSLFQLWLYYKSCDKCCHIIIIIINLQYFSSFMQKTFTEIPGQEFIIL